MEKHTNKKLFAGLLAMSCAFVMSGCDPVESLPANYNDPILEYLLSGDSVETSDNIMGEIYNKISGNKNEKVLQIVLEELANKKFGTFVEIKEAYDAKVGGDNTKMNKFFDDHKEVFKRSEDEEATGVTAQEIRENRFVEFYKDLQDRVSEAFYDLITSGTYNDAETGMFDEEKLWKSLKHDFWDVKELGSGQSFKSYYVTKELTKENAIDSTHLNIELYSNSGKIGSGESERDARGYIEKKVFPQILKDKLVEEYIYTNNFPSLGRAYARKVNFVKVGYEQNTLEYIDYVMNQFAKENVMTNSMATDANLELDYSVLGQTINGFEKINISAKKGAGSLIPLTQNGSEYSLYSTDATAAQANRFNNDYNGYTKKDKVVISTAGDYAPYYKTIDETYIFGENKSNIVVYGDTKLGKLLESYKKAVDGAIAGELRATEAQKTEMSKYTSGASMADSLKQMIIDLAKDDMTTDGWYVKNGGVTELPSAIRDRLFNINVANDLDKTNVNEGAYVVETTGTFGNYRYPQGNTSKPMLTKTPYVRNIQGRKLVMAANADFNNEYNFVYNDSSSFYICQVLEAPSTPKLDKNNASTSYVKADGKVDVIRIENIARTVSKILSTKDTYYNNAYTKYLEEYKFSFNDTSLYEHFKNQYPDLFEDED